MKRKKFLILLILSGIILAEIIGLSIVISNKKKDDSTTKEVANLEENFEENSENEVEEIRLKIEQARIAMQQREQELKENWKEILKKRNKLLREEQNRDSSNIINAVQNIINVGQNISNDVNNNSNNNNSGNNSGNNNTNNGGTEVKEFSTIIENSKTLKDNNLNYTDKVVDLGIPLIQKYSKDTKAHIISRNVWDMQLFNNRIYIGSGDFDSNTGPVDVYYYDIEKEEFVNEGSLPDEQINRFVIVNNQLVITGTDPKAGWDLGTYYVWKNNSWETKKTLLGAIHNFDMVEFHGKIFAGIGNDSDSSVIMSEDGGDTFSYVYMYDYENKKLNIDSITSNAYRVYDFFKHNDKLYAVIKFGLLYEYNEEENLFMRVNVGGITYGDAPGLGLYCPLKTKLEYKENYVFINGDIRYTDNIKDVKNFNKIGFDNTTYVYDAIIINEELYTLCATPVDDKYFVSVYKTTNFENWEAVMYFEYSDFARSFEYSDGTFYFGIGTPLESNDDGTNAGRILKVKIN